MGRIRLVHWHAAEAEARAERLAAAGHAVTWEPLTGAGLRAIRDAPPDAVVIDLGRLPMQGRDVGIAVRYYKATRRVPIVFVGGEPGKVERVRRAVPDAVYTDWRRIRSGLRRALAHPPVDPEVPTSLMAGYHHADVAKKLGIRPGAVVALVDAPDGIEAALGELPEDVTVRRSARGSPDVTLWFVTTRRRLTSRLEAMTRLAAEGGLWIVWPKKASGLAGDLTQPVVRRLGLDAGLVDFKVGAITGDWTGLRFTARKTPSRR